MPTTRYSFSCHTKDDKEIIEFLDSFTPRKRTEMIKQLLSNGIGNTNQSATDISKIKEVIQIELQRFYSRLSQGIQLQPEVTSVDEQLTKEDEQEALSNMLSFLD